MYAVVWSSKIPTPPSPKVPFADHSDTTPFGYQNYGDAWGSTPPGGNTPRLLVQQGFSSLQDNTPSQGQSKAVSEFQWAAHWKQLALHPNSPTPLYLPSPLKDPSSCKYYGNDASPLIRSPQGKPPLAKQPNGVHIVEANKSEDLCALGHCMISPKQYESLFRRGFKAIENLFKEFDEDRCGSVPFPQLKVHLQARGLQDTVLLTELWHKNIDKDNNNQVDIGKFIVVVFFWHARNLGSCQTLFKYDLECVNDVQMTMEELKNLFRSSDANGNGRLSLTELALLFQRHLPNVLLTYHPSFFPQNSTELSFSQFLKLVFVSLGRHMEVFQTSSDVSNRQPEQSQMWKDLTDMYNTLEEDYETLGHGHQVTLQDLLRPAEHELKTFSSPDVFHCEFCLGTATHWCPHPTCNFFVCSHCYELGVQQHLTAFAGPVTETDVEFVCQTFYMVDTEISGQLDYFEYTWFTYCCCSVINYLTICPLSHGAAAVKKGMMSLNAKLSALGKDQNSTLTWDEVNSLYVTCFGATLSRAQALFQQVADEDCVFGLAHFFDLTYCLICPNGKYSAPQRKAVGQIPMQMVTVTEDSVSRPQLLSISHVNLAKIIWGEQLGKGGQSIVYRVTYEGTAMAARKPNPIVPDPAIEDMLKGAKLQMKVRHKNIAHLIGIHDDPVCILMELCEGGDVGSLWSSAPSGVNPILPPLQWRLAMELAEALNAMHTSNPPIMHRDIKGSNVFLTKDHHVLLADFDLAATSPSHGMCGTPGYMAPEVLNSGTYDYSCDIFSYGGFLYEVTHRCFPFSKEVPFTDFHAQVRSLILKGQTPRISSVVPPRMQQLMQMCWQYQANARPTMATVIQLLHAMKADFIS